MKNILGHLAYLLEGSKRIWNVPTYWIKVEANGETFEGEYIYGMVTNAKSVGGFKNLPGQDVRLDDGLFEVTLIKRPKNPLELNKITQTSSIRSRPTASSSSPTRRFPGLWTANTAEITAMSASKRANMPWNWF